MSSTGATTPTAIPTPSTTNVVNASAGAQLGKDDFLKLLIAQLQHQDPTSPMDSNAFMGQLAQFSQLEQTTNMAESVGQLMTATAVTQGVDLIGRNVTFARADGSVGSGIAQSIAIADGAVWIHVGSEIVSPSDVMSVGAASSGSQPATTS